MSSPLLSTFLEPSRFRNSKRSGKVRVSIWCFGRGVMPNCWYALSRNTYASSGPWNTCRRYPWITALSMQILEERRKNRMQIEDRRMSVFPMTHHVCMRSSWHWLFSSGRCRTHIHSAVISLPPNILTSDECSLRLSLILMDQLQVRTLWKQKIHESLGPLVECAITADQKDLIHRHQEAEPPRIWRTE